MEDIPLGAFYDILALKINLALKGIVIDFLCCFCKSVDEDISHLFRDGTVVRRIWRNSSLAISSSLDDSISVKDWLLSYIMLIISKDGVDSTQLVYFFDFLWGIWLARNNVVFCDGNASEAQLRVTITTTLAQHEWFITLKVIP